MKKVASAEPEDQPEYSLNANFEGSSSSSPQSAALSLIDCVAHVLWFILIIALIVSMSVYFSELRQLENKYAQVDQNYQRDQTAVQGIIGELRQQNKALYDLQKYVIDSMKSQQERNLSIAQKIQLPKNIQIFAKIIYRNITTLKHRQLFNEQRIKFFSEFFNYFPELKLAKYTLQTQSMNQAEKKLTLDQDYIRVDKKYNLSLYTKELPMCVIMTGRNNNANFRIEYALNSVFLQNYSNYHAVVVDDFSSDGSQDIYLRYFDFYGLKNDKATLILTDRRITALQNILNAVFNHCKKDQIGVSIDGDDEFIGRNVLSVFNSYYNRNQYGFVYGKLLLVNRKKNIIFTAQDRYGYSQQVKDNQLYRQTNESTFFSHIETWRIDLTYEIDHKDLKDANGKYFNITYDRALFYPIIELSCGEVDLVPELNYLYNLETGLNDYIDKGYQYSVEVLVKNKSRYPCSKIYGSYKSRAEKKKIQKEKENVKNK